MHLYVYYDVPPEQAGAVLARVRAMQAELVGPPGRLFRRDPVAADRATWMEIYEDVAPDFEGRLAACADRHGLIALTGPRHVERFVDLP